MFDVVFSIFHSHERLILLFGGLTLFMMGGITLGYMVYEPLRRQIYPDKGVQYGLITKTMAVIMGIAALSGSYSCLQAAYRDFSFNLPTFMAITFVAVWVAFTVLHYLDVWLRLGGKMPKTRYEARMLEREVQPAYVRTKPRRDRH